MVFRSLSLKKYLDKLSSDSPTPGGGGTSALVAALGAALAVMVVLIMKKRTKEAKRRKKLESLARNLKRKQKLFEAVIDKDPKVYSTLMGTYRRVRKWKDRRAAKARVDLALKRSFFVQRNLASEIALAGEAVSALRTLADGSIANDLRVSRALLKGAWWGAYHTAKINADYIHDAKSKAEFYKWLQKTPRI